ncbi:MAG: molybdenum cofactor guanylyltransferase [Gammaproteobacteria bacterium]|nr:molybdenum cofactor guanylyltransferase [Gammaproteobacteria bacterium]
MDRAPGALPCIGVVLAGGQSRRMGRDKALLAWRGRPLIEHQIALLRDAGVADVQISGYRPGYGGIDDLRTQAGPLAGLAGVAAALRDETELLVVPVDMPRLQPALLHRLRVEEPRAACLRFAGEVLPLRLRLDARCREVLDRLLRSDKPRQRSLRALQQALDAKEIPLHRGEATQLTDCNTPETWNEVVE